MPNKRGCQTKRKSPKKGPPMGLNQSSEHSEADHSKASPVPSREASEDCSGVVYDREIPDQ